ncbi:hypothetical protein GTW64_33470 [Streptomyces sp. SID4923]|nr:hypothetical protein [Streptomyces sp. SID4923]
MFVLCSDGDIQEGISAEAASSPVTRSSATSSSSTTTTGSRSRAVPNWRRAKTWAPATPPRAGTSSARNWQRTAMSMSPGCPRHLRRQPRRGPGPRSSSCGAP